MHFSKNFYFWSIMSSVIVSFLLPIKDSDYLYMYPDAFRHFDLFRHLFLTKLLYSRWLLILYSQFIKWFLYAVAVYGGIVYLMLIYKMWDSIQDGHARTTPWKAVLLQFIPIFSIYWKFVIIPGFAKDYNRFIVRHSLSNCIELPFNLFLSLAILSAIQELFKFMHYIPYIYSIHFHPISILYEVFIYLGSFIMPLGLVLFSIVVWKICSAMETIYNIPITAKE